MLKKNVYISKGVTKKGRNIMKELTLQQQYETCGVSLLTTALIYLLLGTGLYKIYKSKKGRISIPKLLQLEWKN